VDLADRYKLLEKIGAGSFATVYRAQDLELGREVAIKQIQPQFLADSAQNERYWREASLLASFQHPHIVTIYDVVRSRGWLILELLQANLRDRLQGRSMDPKAVQNTVTQALRALSALHGRGLVHGDIKPSNLMIDHRKRVKVGDFGLARRVSHDEGSVIRGTAKYMAPETLTQDFGEVGPQSDLYSLGFTAYDLVCGSRFESLFPGLDAFGRDRQAAWMMWHAAADRKLPEVARVLDTVPPQLSKVIGRLIEKDPKNRFTSADEALAALGASASESTVAKLESGVIAKPAASRSRGRWPLYAAFGGSMALSAAMLFWPSQPPAVVVRENHKPIVGVIRSVDLDHGTLEIIDPETGQPEELKLPANPRIRLLGDGTREELILPKRLQPGDWVRPDTVEGRWQLDVARPLSSEGKLLESDAAGNRVTVSIEQHRVRDSVPMHVPPQTQIELNAKPADLRDLAAGDRVTVEHVLDPSGKQGRVVSRLQAFRLREVVGSITAFNAGDGMLSVATGGSKGAESIPLDANTTLAFDDGQPAAAADLQPGRRVVVAADSLGRKVILSRDAETASGLLSAVDPDQRTLKIDTPSAKGQSFTIPQAAVVRINQTPAELTDLRPQVDKLQIFARSDAPDGISAVDATRAPQFDRCVIAVAAASSRNESLPVIAAAADDARLIYDSALNRYATSPDWASLLIDPTAADVRDQLTKRAASLRPGTQAIVYIAAHVLVDGDQVWLGLADSNPKEAKSGVTLDEIINEFEKSASQQKILVLDLAPSTSNGTAPAPIADVLGRLKSKPTSSVLFAAMRDPSLAAEQHSPLASAVAAGLSGKADADRNLMVTPDELATWLKTQVPAAVRWPVP
jgi:serine/threonine-protein kinase